MFILQISYIEYFLIFNSLKLFYLQKKTTKTTYIRIYESKTT